MRQYKRDLLKGLPIVIIFIILLICSLICRFCCGTESAIYENVLIVTQFVGMVAIPYIGVALLLVFLNLLGDIVGNLGRYTNRIDKNDIVKYKKYNRDILKEYSPCVLGYIDNFRLNKNYIVAEVLYMLRKEILFIKDNRIEKNENLNMEELNSVQKAIVEDIINGKIFVERGQLEFKSQKILEEKKMVSYREKTNINYHWIYFFTALALAIGIIFTLIPPEELFSGNEVFKYGWIEAIFSFLAFLLVVWGWMLIFVYIFGDFFRKKYSRVKGDVCRRTHKGKSLNNELEGLKNYLKDYSMLSEREAKEVELWEDYLIYSVMFGQNKKIVEEYEKYIEIE